MSSRMKGKGKRSNPDSTANGNGHHANANGISNGNGVHNGVENTNGTKKFKNGHSSSAITFMMSSALSDAQNELKQAWSSTKKESNSEQIHKDVTLIKEPFQCCVVNNLIENSKEFFPNLKRELADVEMVEKNNDLYKFKQSGLDLTNTSDLEAPHIGALKRFLQNDVRKWLQNVTGTELDSNIDMFCARYGYTDHLLCHDDELEGRRIAYIMYFVKNWTEEDGGTLDLFDRDELGHPKDVVKRLVPLTNSLAFFEVTEKSYHQVSEILTKDKTRLSVGGWFHGTSIERPLKAEPVDLQPPQEPVDIDEDEFYSWINPMYLDPDTQAEIQIRFETSSEISLQEFLNDDKAKAVSDYLKAAKNWKKVGPADRRCFETIDTNDDNEDILAKCCQFLKSDAFFLLLSSLTGLRLHPLAPEQEETPSEKEEENGVAEDDQDADEMDVKASTSKAGTPDEEPTETNGTNGNHHSNESKEPDPKCRVQVRRWTRGCYTLLHDKVKTDFCLDGRLFFNCQDWSIESGGFTSYVAKDEDEELLTAMPEDNTLTLVYKDAQTLGFVKYVNDNVSTMSNGEFHDISAVYYE